MTAEDATTGDGPRAPAADTAGSEREGRCGLRASVSTGSRSGGRHRWRPTAGDPCRVRWTGVDERRLRLNYAHVNS